MKPGRTGIGARSSSDERDETMSSRLQAEKLERITRNMWKEREGVR